MRKKSLWLILVVVVLSAGAVMPVYRQVKIWRAQNLAEEAALLMGEPDSIIRAWELAHAANALDPDGLEVARTLAQVYTVVEPTEAPTYWQRVVELSQEPEDRYLLAQSALAAQQWELFDAQLELLRSEGIARHRIQLLQAKAAAKQGDYHRALALAADIIKEQEREIAADLLYVQLTQLSSDESVRMQGVDHLWELAASENKERALAGVYNLARAPALSVEETERLAQRIEDLAEGVIELKLLALEVTLRLPSSSAGEVAAKAASFFAIENDEELLALARWLNLVGLAEETIEYVPESRALTRQDLFLVRADALALQGRWDAVGALLNRPRVPIEDYVRAFFLMRVGRETGQTKQANLEWQRALILAGHDANKVHYLAEKVRLLGERVFYRQALERMTEIPLLRLRGYEGLIGEYYDEGEAEALFKILQQTSELFPENSAIRNDYLYIGFLIGALGSEHLGEAQMQMAAQPTILSFRMTYALGLLRAGHLDRAYAILAETPVDWRAVSDRWKALVVHVLLQAGQIQDAEELLRTIQSERLLNEERSLITL